MPAQAVPAGSRSPFISSDSASSRAPFPISESLEHDRDCAHRAVRSDTQRGGLQDPVLEKMRLQDAVIVEGRPVPDLDEIPFQGAGGVDTDAASDARPEQPELPGKQRNWLEY